MATDTSSSVLSGRPSFRDLFTPKLITILSEGYDFQALRADIMAGLTVAIVALPLSMAIAVASGAAPERGLYAAIVGGFLVSTLGGRRFQIGGPPALHHPGRRGGRPPRHRRHGPGDGAGRPSADGAGSCGWGKIQFIPLPVTVGFTVGIAVIIFASQLSDLFGLTLTGNEPGRDLLPKLAVVRRGPA